MLGENKVFYYPFKGTVMKTGVLTRNRTKYDLSAGYSMVESIRNKGFNLGGWMRHHNSDPSGAKVTYISDKFRMSGSDVIAEGYIKYDAETSSMIEDVRNGFRQMIPVSIACKIKKYTEERVEESATKTYVFLEVDPLQFDIVAVESNQGCGIIPDFTRKLDKIPEDEVARIAYESPDEDGTFYESENGEHFDRWSQGAERVSEPPISATSDAHESASEAELEVNQPNTHKKDLGAPSDNKHLKESDNMNEESNVETDVTEAVNQDDVQLESIFDEDVKTKKDAEFQAFRTHQAKSAHKKRLDGFRRGASAVYSKEGVEVIEGILDVMLESTAAALNVPVYSLDNETVTECAKRARNKYVTGQIDGGQSIASRASKPAISNNMLSPNFQLGQTIIEGLNKGDRFAGKLNGVKWADIIKVPRIRSMLITAMQHDGVEIKRQVNNYHNLINAYESVVEPARLQAAEHGYYSDEMSPQTLGQLRQIDGIVVESSILDSGFHGSPTVTAELLSCVPTILTAICTYINPLLSMLSPMESNHVVRHSHRICRPDTAQVIQHNFNITEGTFVDVTSNGIMAVYVVDNSSGSPVLVQLSDSYASDYLTFASANAVGDMSVMVINSDIYDDYGDGVSADFVIEVLPRLDPCEVPYLIEVDKENFFVQGEYVSMAVPRCETANKVFMNNYGVNVVSQALEYAGFIVDEYWTELLMAKIRLANDACFAVEVQQAILTAQATGTPYVTPDRLMPCWNATSIPLYSGDTQTNGTFASLLQLVRALKSKCSNGTSKAVTIIVTHELANLLYGWAISNQVNNHAGNIKTDENGNIVSIANMKVVTAGNSDLEDITYTDASGTVVTAQVYMNMVYLLGPSALYGKIERTTVKNQGRISRVSTYTCADDPEDTRQLVTPTGKELMGFNSYARLFADSAQITGFKAVVPVIASNNCGNQRLPSISTL